MTTTVTSIIPDLGGCAGGDTLTIEGSGFTGATAVAFGGQPANSFTVNSDTVIHATTPPIPGPFGPPPSPAGVSVTVGGNEAFGPNFTWTAAPQVVAWVSQTASVTSISPTSGTSPGGQTMTISGTGLSKVVEVDFCFATSGVGPGMSGSWTPASFTIDSDTQITATVPALGIGYGYIYYVTVTTAAGVSPAFLPTPNQPNQIACAFTYNA